MKKRQQFIFTQIPLTIRPLLEKANEAFVVNPDQSLAELANDQGWPVISFAD